MASVVIYIIHLMISLEEGRTFYVNEVFSISW